MKTINKATFILTILLITALLLPNAPRAGASFGNFSYSGDYRPGQFRDVSRTHWYAQYVEHAYNLNLMRGRSADIFAPDGLLTAAEAVILAARLRSIYHTGEADFPITSPYYDSYVEYAVTHGIIESFDSHTTPVTRAQFAQMLRNSLPAEAYPAINSIPDYAINDVVPGENGTSAVYDLYRAGIFAGSDRYGTFHPQQSITRAEACAAIVRIAEPGLRLNTKLPGQLPAEVIYRRSVNAVISIETFDGNGRSIRTGSGFFITGTGHIATALHVIDNAASATVTLLGGDTYDVKGVLAMSEEFNVALLAIDSDSNSFGYLTVADSDLVETGNTVYALGNPLNYTNTISDGIVAHTNRVSGDDTFIMFTAPISFGSGGGPVLNALGQVIGIASSSFTWGQNLNLAIPINHIKALSAEEPIPLKELLEIRT